MVEGLGSNHSPTKKKTGYDMHTCNPNYSGGRGKRIESLKLIWAKLVKLCLNKIQTKGLGAWFK
jgi:hypothetical protein